jgi:hypothetical protein
MKKIAALLILLPLFSACSIKQTVDSADINREASVCVVENTKVREGFLLALEESLVLKNIKYVVVEPNDRDAQCDAKITYTANWTWDLAIYMTYAEINLYSDGKLAGKATYDSRMGGGRLDKFISADDKVKELMNELIRVNQALLAPQLGTRQTKTG